MASEVISHAIFASSHPIPPHSAPHCLPLRLPPRAALHIPPCTPPSIPPELRPAPCPPLFTLLCAALHPPRTPSCTSPCAPTPFHTTHFHRTSLLHRIPLAKSLPSTNFPSASLHPSPFLSQVPSPSIPPELHPASHPALHPA